MKRFQTAAVAALILSCLTSSGCDEMAGAAMELAIDGSGNVDPNSFAGRLKAEQKTCPRQLNEHTTLKSVALRGVNTIRYTYSVTESGRPHVNMTVQSKVQREVLRRAKTSYLGPAIAKAEMKVDHFFEDADGKCLLWLEMTSEDYIGVDFEKPKPGAGGVRLASIKKVDTAAARKAMGENLDAIQAQLPIEIDEHTTLKKVIQKGKNRIKYLYVVSPAGRKIVNMNHEDEIRRQVIERTNASPLGKSIIDLDLGVEHFFQDTDGQCTLWLNMTKKDFVDGPQEQPEPEEAADEQVEEASSVTKFEPWMPSVFGGGDAADNPPGVQTNPYVK